jgi:RNA polymerase sigma factor (sigma-70 family)
MDERALQSMWDEYHIRLRSYILVRTREPAVADDLLQETFIRAWKAVGRGTIVSAVGPWLYTIATNLVRDWAVYHARESRTMPLDEVIESLATTADDEPDAEPEIDCDRLMAQLQRCLTAALGCESTQPAIRAAGRLRKFAFMYYYVDGLTIEQLHVELAVVAGSLGVDAPTLTMLNNWLCRGDVLARLVAHLVREYPELIQSSVRRSLLALDLTAQESAIARGRWFSNAPIDELAKGLGMTEQQMAHAAERITLRLTTQLTANMKAALHVSRRRQ